jgi:hypothetical protein
LEKWKFLTLPGLELRPLGRPARSQSLYRLSYPGSGSSIISLIFLESFGVHLRDVRMYCLISLEHWDCAFESHSGLGYMSTFSCIYIVLSKKRPFKGPIFLQRIPAKFILTRLWTKPITAADRPNVWNIYALLNIWIMGSNPTRYVYSMCCPV